MYENERINDLENNSAFRFEERVSGVFCRTKFQ